MGNNAARMESIIDLAVKDRQIDDSEANINPARRRKLVTAFAKADEKWPIVENGQPLFQWGYGLPERDEPLTPMAMRDLADAIEILSKAGVSVRYGQSARGITYLNIDIWPEF